MQFYFKPRVTIVCVVLALLMARLSFWQWERHQAKLAYIQQLESNLAEPVTPFSELVRKPADLSSLLHRRVSVSGTYDFAHEIVLRNRKYQDAPGVHVLTPLRIEGEAAAVLVSRGFLPLDRAKSESRKEFQREERGRFTGIIKEAKSKRLFAPADPPSGPPNPWVDAWLRVDISNISKQLPYPIFPIYLEVMESADANAAKTSIVRSDEARGEIFFLPSRAGSQGKREFNPAYLPIPSFDTIVPAGRHYGYVWEWGFMALATLLIGLGLQLRPPPRLKEPT